MTRNPVGWFEIYVQDMERARRFYEAVFRTTLQKLNSPGPHEMWAFPMAADAGGASGALIRMPGVASGNGGTMVYFSCADCADEAARVVQAGGRIENPKMSIGEYGFVAHAIDTEGNMFGLHSMQ
jgi:predicted enzyme related to lactoylglutathione lyase